MKQVLAVLLLFSISAVAALAQSPAVPKPFIVEYYYKIKWGHAQEFIDLYKKNHVPILKKQIEMGRLISADIVAPRYHMPEEGRWDFRVIIVFKDAETSVAPFDEAALARQLFPDQATYRKEELRRSEIVDGHWDLPVSFIDLNAAP